MRPPRAGNRDSARYPSPARTSVRRYKVARAFRDDAARSVRDAGELRFTRGAHPLEIVAGVIARPGQRRRSDLQETLGARDLRIGVEGLRGPEIDHLGVLRLRSAVLAHRHE